MNPTYRKINTDFIKKDKDELSDEEREKQKKINAKKREEQMNPPEPPKPKHQSPSPPPEGPPGKRVEHPDDENVEGRLDDLESKVYDPEDNDDDDYDDYDEDHGGSSMDDDDY